MAILPNTEYWQDLIQSERLLHSKKRIKNTIGWFLLGMDRYHIFADMLILVFADTADIVSYLIFRWALVYWIEQLPSFPTDSGTAQPQYAEVYQLPLWWPVVEA